MCNMYLILQHICVGPPSEYKAFGACGHVCPHWRGYTTETRLMGNSDTPVFWTKGEHYLNKIKFMLIFMLVSTPFSCADASKTVLSALIIIVHGSNSQQLCLRGENSRSVAHAILRYHYVCYRVMFLQTYYNENS